MIIAENPILPGFYPDPSICRVGETFYLVNSTFAYFPGVPVFRSHNLAQWEQIGNVLERGSQVPLKNCGHSEGIYAPTIRYHDGTFYMITTNVSGGGNFIVTAKDGQGPWSEPYYLGEEAKGIDPSLFFDEDGTCYYIGQRENSRGGQYFGDCEIWIRELDLGTMRLTGEGKAVLYGFQKHAVWPEGPHLYKKDGYYYILHAESGTELNHCIVVARSRSIWGPYEYCPANPILTHRHLGKDYPVTCVGHGDLVDDGHGNWYMVMLACRPKRRYTLLGRETFLAKIIWEDGWPVVNPGAGKIEKTIELPGELSECGKREMHVYRFDGEKLPPEFLMLRNPPPGMLSLRERRGYLRLYMQNTTLKDKETPAFVALRQRHHAYEVRMALEPHFTGAKGECAGAAIVQSDAYHIRMECFPSEDRVAVRLIFCIDGKDTLLAAALGREDGRCVQIRLVVDGLKAAFYYACGDKKEGDDEGAAGIWQLLMDEVDIRSLSTECAGGFVGCTVGMYAASGCMSGGYADFSEFTYKRMMSLHQAEKEYV